MKSLLSSSFWKTAQLIIPLSLIIGSSTIAQAKDKNPLFCGLIRPGGSDYPVGSSRGYLMVYLRADESYDGNAWYFHKTFSPSTRSTESSLKTSQANIPRTRKFPRSWRCRLDLTWSLLDRRRTDISACPLPSRRASERFSTWISGKRAHQRD
jgi:hypothetical protein